MIRKSLRIWVKVFESFKIFVKSLRIGRLMKVLKVIFNLLPVYDKFGQILVTVDCKQSHFVS